MSIPLSRFVQAASKTISRAYCVPNRSAWCFVHPDARPVVSPVNIWFPLTCGKDRTGRAVMVRDAVSAKYQEEIDEKIGTLFRQYVRANGGDPKSISARLVSFTRSPFGIQIPNPDPPEIIEWKPNAEATVDRIPVGVSFDQYGEMIEWWNRTDDTHAIIAGATNSGKSNTILSWVAHLVENESPDDLEIVPIDLKRRALRPLEDVPHVRLPLAYTKEAAAAALMAVDAEQNRRIEGDESHPTIALVIDELTDALQGDDVAQDAFSRITRKGRELGIFVIAGTQKPMLTGEGQGIAQILFRFVGRMKTDRDAKLVAGEEIDASRLRHPGSFYAVTGRGEPVAVRVPYIAPERFADVAAAAARRYPSPSTSVLTLPEVEPGTTGKAIAKAAVVRNRAEENLMRLRDEFGDTLQEQSMRQMILALGLSANGNSYYRSERIVNEALELIKSDCYGVTYVT